MATASRQSVSERTRESFENARSATRDAARKRAARLALSVIDFQQKTFDSTVDGIGKVQEQSGKMLHNLAQNASWVPDEGKEVVDEWITASKRGREEFKKTMDKSFTLVSKYFKRVERESNGGLARTGPVDGGGAESKRPTKRRAAPKRKSTAKKKSAAK